MFNTGILDVVIGIVFVYLLVSLMVTAVSELLAAAVKYRRRILWRALPLIFCLIPRERALARFGVAGRARLECRSRGETPTARHDLGYECQRRAAHGPA